MVAILALRVAASSKWHSAAVQRALSHDKQPTECEKRYGPDARLFRMQQEGQAFLQCRWVHPEAERLLRLLADEAVEEEKKLPSRRRSDEQILTGIMRRERAGCPKGLTPRIMLFPRSLWCAAEVPSDQACAQGELGPYDPLMCYVPQCGDGQTALAARFRGSLGEGCVDCAPGKIDVAENETYINRQQAMGMPPVLKSVICRN
jgi:hypothetical protein